MAIADAKTDDAKFDAAAKWLLSLGVFSNDLAKAIREKCLEITPVKRILANTTYGTDIERWPIETPASFWTGIALAIFGLLLGPAFSWIVGASPDKG